MSERKRRIYAVEGYPEEVIAVAFAKTSRSPSDIDRTLAELNEDKARQFHEKWVVGYGHASVAEHAVIHMAIENVTRLAVEQIEARRLGSYEEKSTRFQIIEPDDYYLPPAVMESPMATEYIDAHTELFAAYRVALVAVAEEVKRMYPKREGEDEKKHETRVRTKYVDICRYGLPVSVLAKLGMTANARVWEYECGQLMSSDLVEVREIGEEMRQEALRVAPTLVKYAAASEFLRESRTGTRVWVRERNDQPLIDRGRVEAVMPRVELIDWDKHGEIQVLAGWLFKFSGRSYGECVEEVERMSSEAKTELVNVALGRMGRFDKPGREFELASCTFDLLLDTGSFHDFKRNRMMTQIHQESRGSYGIALPAVIDRVGVGEQMRRAIAGAEDLAVVMRPKFEGEDEYLHTNAVMRRMLMKMNLRELVDFWRTRSAPNTNQGYRYLALKMGELAGQVYPTLWGVVKAVAKDEAPPSSEVRDDFYGRGG